MSVPEVAPLVPERHRWHLKPDSRITQRRALGVEVILGRKDANTRGENDIHQLTTLTVTKQGLSLSTLRGQLKAGLLSLRYRHPECACKLAWDGESIAPWIQYSSPESHDAAKAWAKETVHVYASPKTGVEMWNEIEDKRRAGGYAEPEKSVSVHVVADVADEKTPIPAGIVVYILCNMNHTFWDGFTARSFIGQLLKGLNKAPEEPTSWGQEAINLSKPLLDAMKPYVEYEGENFVAARDEFLKIIYGTYASWGLRFREGKAEPRVIYQTLTPTESKAIITAIKSRLGPKYTISHLGQAATFLAMLETNPPAADIPEDQAFTTPMAISGRRWLDEALEPTYFGICLSGGVVKFNNVKSLIVNRNNKQAVSKALERACVDVKDSFDHLLNGKHQLPIGIAAHNFEGEFLAANPNPFKNLTSPTFLSDGLNDRFIPKEIVKEGTNETLMAVDHAIFYQTQWSPFYVLRLESFRDASTLSLTYNEGNHTPDEANAFLKSVLYYMATFAEAADPALETRLIPVEAPLPSKTVNLVHLKNARSLQLQDTDSRITAN